jgi:sigma-B regulation protein RsbU (phosphoserine phosphatase)
MSPAVDHGEVEQLTLELLDRYEEINLLYDIGQALAGVFDVDAIGHVVVDRAMAVIHAAGGLFLVVEGETARVGYRTGDVPAPLLDGLSAGDLLRRALAAPVLIMQPLLAVRVQRDAQPFGVLALAGKRDGSVFTASDGRLLQALAEQAAAAIHTGRLVRELRASERIRSEMEIARQLQRSLLPASNPRILGVDVAATCQPSGHVGGDYFDFFSLPDGRFGVVIADVSGHGVSSAIVMAGLRSTIHAEVQSGFAPEQVLRRANALLARDFAESGMFVSAFLAAYEPATGALTYVNAGHPPPFLLTAPGTEMERLEQGGLLLGVVPDVVYESGKARLDPGSVLVLYTDGLTEARAPDGAFFGEPTLARVLLEGQALGSAALHTAILGAATTHLGGREPEDDVTLIVVSRRG